MLVMCRGLVGASHRIVIRYPIRRRVCTAQRTATRRMPHGGGAQLGATRVHYTTTPGPQRQTSMPQRKDTRSAQTDEIASR